MLNNEVAVDMPRKKPGKKSTNNVNDENVKKNENGIEKGLGTSDDKIDNHDTNSIDSKSSGSSISLKKRFSFGKRKKNLEHLKRNKLTDQETAVDNGDLRRTNSLNNIQQDGGKSKIPILKPKRQHIDTKHGSKHELCPRRVQKNGCCESRSLVLNPGMDSWRMAGLMDTVSNTYSTQTLNSMNSIVDVSGKPPNVALCSRLAGDSCKKSLEKVNDDEVRRSSPRMSSPVVIVTENVEGERTLNQNGDVTSPDVPELHGVAVVEEEMIEVEGIPLNPHLDISEVVVEQKTEKTVCMGAPFDTHKDFSNNIAMTTSNVNNEPVLPVEITLNNSSHEIDTRLDTECTVEPAVVDYNEVPFTNGTTLTNGVEHTPPEYLDVYELDDDNIISIRRLQDLISEHEIQLPKEVCCDDWLVLDISHSTIVST